MSAWMVSNKTLSEIANLIDAYKIVGYNGFGFNFPSKLMETVKGMTTEEIFKALAEMNIEALKQRYDDYEDMIGEVKFDPDADVYKPRNNGLTYHWQLLKSLQCYLYQCSEGNVPERELYKCIDKLSIRVAGYIISQMPEYQATEWR